MKVAVAELPTGEASLVEVVDGSVLPIVGAEPSDLIAVCLDRDQWTERGAAFEISDVRFRPPIARPVSLRDFMAYEAHITNTMQALGQPVNPAWYDAPICYFGNPNAIIGDGDTVPRPRGSVRLDYELEVAAIIGLEASNIDASAANALDCIAGFTFMNDWSARDLSAKEMRHFMGPMKGKDFATSLGPWVVTPDEFVTLSAGVIDEEVVARINGDVTTKNNLAGMYFKWPEILAHASANVTLVPGDVIGSGTVGFGCILELRTKNKELGSEVFTFLADGDVVELESETFGVLRNVIGSD
jgi:2-keto-4-pentenoate hydratase/2-oxohepta-3-ene-1,7-dioic acid hydratase in catechol pathway